MNESKLIRQLEPLITKKSKAEIKKSICGEFLGEGSSRKCYVLKQNPNYVVKTVKFARKTLDDGNLDNILEWRNWHDYHLTALGRWLAPCVTIDDKGYFLVQKRVYFNKRRIDYPKYIPYELTDTKLQNFGWIGDQCTCCDYASLVHPMAKKKKWARWIGSLKK